VKCPARSAALHVEAPGQRQGLLACRRGEDGGQEVDLGDVLAKHQHVQHLLVHHVQADIRAGTLEQVVLLAQVGGEASGHRRRSSGGRG